MQESKESGNLILYIVSKRIMNNTIMQQATILKYLHKANGDGAMDETKLSGVINIKKNKKGQVRTFRYHNANVVKLYVPQIGAAQAVEYDIKAFKWCLEFIKSHKISDAIIYVLACRIGPFFGALVNKAHKLGVKVYVNPDGHEWKRAKWSGPIRKYWKESERLMVKHKAFEYIDTESNLVLLLNSDVEIKNKYWLKEMVRQYKRGVLATDRRSEMDNRPDGWCFMIDKDLYNIYRLDDKKFDVYYSCADLCAKVINAGYEVQTIEYYENFIHHFGSASGKFKSNFSKDKLINSDEISSWFNKPCCVIKSLNIPHEGDIATDKDYEKTTDPFTN